MEINGKVVELLLTTNIVAKGVYIFLYTPPAAHQIQI